MTERVFADTNVWVYLVDGDEPSKQGRARDVLTPRAGTIHVTSAQVMSEFYVTSTRKLSRPVSADLASRIVERMAHLDVIALDTARIRAAIDGARTWGISYWDALIVVAAQAGGCRRLITEDLQDGATYGGVRVENPFLDRPRVQETPIPYGAARDRWTDEDLREDLARYEAACRDAGMRPNAIHSYWDYARRFLDWRTGDYRPRGSPEIGRRVPPGPVTAADLEAQAHAYADVIEAAGREQPTIDTYLRHALFFVRWLQGDFQPGARLKGARSVRLLAAPDQAHYGTADRWDAESAERRRVHR